MKIKKLIIYTNNLSKQTQFYSKVLGFEIVETSDIQVSFQIGSSVLIFEHREKCTPYHFAINIPSNKEEEALHWLKKRVTILKDEGNDIQYFDFWNAYAIYFYDADKNIVEFIARKNLNSNSKQTFSQKSILGISEIGLPTTDIEREFNLLNKKCDIPQFSGNLEAFCTIGSETGLFICVNKNKKEYWYPTKDKPYSSDFRAEIEEKNATFIVDYRNEILNVSEKITNKTRE